ncbi:MAG: type 4a pilus biogenesis protein PilO [Gammaproteobacteria bacterium]|nr:type 4a pilus biogenesis protein PilO [Gammaproteobacteria bacterium]MBU1482159.1 type 4a pilus biogenesis protein PilO [Gammaproteobacteria bacterium]
MRKQISELKEQLGWQGMSGLVLLALSGALHVLALQPLEQETAFMHSRLDAAHAKSDLKRSAFSLGDRQKELGIFFNSLPAEQDVTDILASISIVAEASKVELKQAEYRIDEKNKPRLEYGLVFPVQGGYANIRHFVFRVLADHPAIALDQINFQRDKVNDSVLKAEIRLTLFLQTQK